jgi:hypothetical protein
MLDGRQAIGMKPLFKISMGLLICFGQQKQYAVVK